ncbi:MAG: DUF2303 family protein [Phycisphaerales bacterium]|nr:DUF2303 family protein [Phycisphaerales bacterium]
MTTNIKEALNHLLKLTPPSVELGGNSVLHFLKRDGYDIEELDTRGPAKRHQLTDVDSLISYLKRHGEAEHTTVFCSEDGFVAVLHDRTGDRNEVDRDRVDFTPQKTDAFKEWEQAFKRGKFSHIDLRNFIEDHRHQVVTRSMIAAVKNFAVNQQIQYDGNLDNGEQIAIRVIRQRGQKTENGVVEMDRLFEIDLPIIIGVETLYRLQVRIESQLVEDKVFFTIEPRNLGEVMHQLVEDMIAYTREQLGDGWLVVRGAPKSN